MSKGIDVGNLTKAAVENNKQNKFGQGLNKLGKGINKGIEQYGDYIGTGLTLAGNALFG
jgi:hypothetical protein